MIQSAQLFGHYLRLSKAPCNFEAVPSDDAGARAGVHVGQDSEKSRWRIGFVYDTGEGPHLRVLSEMLLEDQYLLLRLIGEDGARLFIAVFLKGFGKNRGFRRSHLLRLGLIRGQFPSLRTVKGDTVRCPRILRLLYIGVKEVHRGHSCHERHGYGEDCNPGFSVDFLPVAGMEGGGYSYMGGCIGAGCGG